MAPGQNDLIKAVTSVEAGTLSWALPNPGQITNLFFFFFQIQYPAVKWRQQLWSGDVRTPGYHCPGLRVGQSLDT